MMQGSRTGGRLSLVGKILHKVQLKQKGKMRYDKALTAVEPKITPSLISKVRYGLQRPTPLFIATIIKCYNLIGKVVFELIRALHATLRGYHSLRIHYAVVWKNERASEFLAKCWNAWGRFNPFVRIFKYAHNLISGMMDKIKSVCTRFSFTDFRAHHYAIVTF